MKIRYFGHSHFLFEGENYSLMLDPFSNIGLKEFSFKCDYVFCSHNHYDHNNVKLAVNAEPVKDQPFFKKVKTYHDEKSGVLRGENTVLIFEMDGYRVAFMGDIGQVPDGNLLENLKEIDLLLIPVGSTYTIDAKTAYEYFIKSGAKAVIPMHYHVKGSTVDIDGVEPFLSKFDKYVKKSSPLKYNGETGVIYLTSEQGE